MKAASPPGISLRQASTARLPFYSHSLSRALNLQTHALLHTPYLISFESQESTLVAASSRLALIRTISRSGYQLAWEMQGTLTLFPFFSSLAVIIYM
jgi:hypothetical protein